MTHGELQTFLDAFKESSDFDSQSFLQLYNDTNEETVLKILARFQETLALSLEQIHFGFVNDDAEKVWKSSHKIAGSAELLGFQTYGGFARELSGQIRANPVISSHQDEIEDFVSMTMNIKDKIAKIYPHLANRLL